MRVSIIIVTYNSSSVVGACLDSIARQPEPPDREVIVVDNASSDGTTAMISERYPWVRLIANRKNLGYSQGVNMGIRAARGEYYFVLNPDTLLAEGGLGKLVEFMDSHQDVGIVGPKLVFLDGNIQYSCRRFYNWKVLLLRRTPLGRLRRHSRAIAEHLMLNFDHNSTREVDWVLGACMMVRRKAVEAVGLMDERFFLYFEDVDWCYRMKQGGWKVIYYPEAVITHGYARESAQSVLNRSFLVHLASMVRYYEKWNRIWYYFKKYREPAKIGAFLLLDLIAFNAAFFIAYQLRASLHTVFTNPIFPIAAYRGFVLFENLLFILTYLALDLYRIRRETTYAEEFLTISRAILLASVLLMASTYLSHVRTYSRMVVAFLVPSAVLADWGLRSLARSLHRRLVALKIDLKRVCLVGPVARAKELEGILSARLETGMEVVGIVASDDGGEGNSLSSLGRLADLEALVEKYRIQELVFLPGAVSAEELTRFVAMGRRRMLDITVLTDYTTMVVHQAEVASLAGLPVITYRRDTSYMADRLAKRAIDLVLSFAFLMVSWPLFLVYYLFKLARGERPLTWEERLGLRGMRLSLPVAGGSTPDGPSDLVNAPLFLLVLVGKLSMVGPYPLPAALAEREEPLTLSTRPGVTGYWRMGWEAEVDLKDLLVKDASYLRNWSLLEDLRVLLSTMGSILRGNKRIVVIKN